MVRIRLLYPGYAYPWMEECLSGYSSPLGVALRKELGCPVSLEGFASEKEHPWEGGRGGLCLWS